jgi:hypothetical protein
VGGSGVTENIYHAPAKFGLGSFGSIDFSSGCYEFDLTVVWQDEHGRFLYGDDSGCSCPQPFDGWVRDDLTEVTSLAEFQAHLLGRQRHLKFGFEDEAGEYDRTPQIAELIERMHREGAR